MTTPWYRSIRTKISAALALGVLGTCVLLSWVVDHETTDDAVHELRQRAIAQLAVATASYDFAGTLLEGASLGSDSVVSSVPSLASRLRRDSVVTWYDGRTMWAVRRVDDGQALTIGLAAEQIHQRRAVVHRALLSASAVAVLGASLAGWFVAGSLTSRLRRVAHDVAQSSHREDPQHTGGPILRRVGDEVSEVAGRIDELTRTLATQLDRERRFSADVAHELRTPMTALVSATELLPEGDGSRLVRRQTKRLRKLVEDLLELARAEHGELVSEPLDLGSVVTALAEDYPGVVVRLDEPDHVSADRRRLERIVANLIANALQHGAPPVDIVVAGHQVAVMDRGPGFPADILELGPRRFATEGKSGSVGLGLSIAQAWAERLGATLTLTNTATGACAILRLDRREEAER